MGQLVVKLKQTTEEACFMYVSSSRIGKDDDQGDIRPIV